MMNLVIDIGNTRVKSATFKGRELSHYEDFKFDIEKINNLLLNHSGRIIVSSVIDPKLLSSIQNINSFLIQSSTKYPIQIQYDSLESLGKDRLANAIAIHQISKGKNAIVIDCGTCLKFDSVIDEKYMGGSISPGLSMRLQSLHTFTGKLPLIKKERFDILNGKSTRESILSGCYRGMLAEIIHTLNDYENKFGEIDVYLTGGDHELFVDHFKNRIFADPFLTLKGLNEILLFQET